MTTWPKGQFILIACFVALVGCGGQRTGGGGESAEATEGKLRSIYEGCPRGASEDYKEGWSYAIRRAYGSHDQMSDLRQRIDSGVLIQKNLNAEMKVLREDHQWKMSQLRKSLELTNSEKVKGEIDGSEYAWQKIIKTTY